MEITFQNKREDLHAFYDYSVRETLQGKAMSAQAFRYRQTWMVITAVLIGAFLWGATGQWDLGLRAAIIIFLATEAIFFLISGFKPYYYEGIQVYNRQEELKTVKDFQVFQLPKTLTIDDRWLEIRNSEALQRWRWRQVDKIYLTSSFIFIYVDEWRVWLVPKRDFSSEQRYVEFGNKLVELKEKNEGQPIGAE